MEKANFEEAMKRLKEMANEFLTVSDGTFSLSETENKNKFYFYRNDGNVLTNICMEPMTLLQLHCIMKMKNGEITEIVMKDFCLEMSDDGKYIIFTIGNIDEKTVSNKHPNFLRYLFPKNFKIKYSYGIHFFVLIVLSMVGVNFITLATSLSSVYYLVFAIIVYIAIFLHLSCFLDDNDANDDFYEDEK